MTLTSIIDTSIKVPRSYFKVSLGVGSRSAGAAPRKVLLLGSMLGSGGSGVVGTLYTLSGPDDARTYFGPGSELHLMAKAAFLANKAVTLYGMATTVSGATEASSTITYTGTATAAGYTDVTIMGETIRVAIASGDTPTAIAAAVDTAINDKTDWPVTSSPAVGVVTVSSKVGWVSARANRITIRATVAATSVSVAVSGSGFLAGTAGGRTDDLNVKLALVAGERFHHIVCPASDATGIGYFKTHVDTYGEPLEGKRQRFFAMTSDTVANALTLAGSINGKRGVVSHLKNSDTPPSCVAAAVASHLASKWGADPAANTDGQVVRGVLPHYSIADKPTFTEVNNMLGTGLTPLLTVDGDATLTRVVTNYHKDASSNPDYSVIDAHYVTTADYVADDLEANFASTFGGFKIADDNDEGSPPAARVATPSTVKDWIYSRLLRLDATSGGPGPICMENVVENEPNLIVERDPSAAGRINAEIPCDPVELFHQFAAEIRQV